MKGVGVFQFRSTTACASSEIRWRLLASWHNTIGGRIGRGSRGCTYREGRVKRSIKEKEGAREQAERRSKGRERPEEALRIGRTTEERDRRS